MKQNQNQGHERTDWVAKGEGVRESCTGSLGLADAKSYI